MINKWFSSDTHFGHYNILNFCKRPFASIEEMDEILIERWNNRVKPNDIIYHLGDVAWGSNGIIQYVPKLNGQIILIKGNHDRIHHDNAGLFKEVHPGFLNIKVSNHELIVLCHFSMRVWDRSHYNSWHLYGHSHGMLPPEGKSWDVGVDANNYAPVSLDEIRQIMKSRPNNFNYIGK
jgi:calcineurin-like phosphoesterase family protein